MAEEARRDIKEDGYWVGPLLDLKEVCHLRYILSRHFDRRIKSLGLNGYDEGYIRDAGIWSYAGTCDAIDHGNVWPTNQRVLTSNAVSGLKSMLFWQKVKNTLGDFEISSEEGVRERVNWRIVRPGHPEDVGPVHADGWFWDANEWKIPEGVTPYKIWVMVGAGDKGFCGVPGSHKKAYPYVLEERHGKMKPKFNPEALGIKPIPFHLPAGYGVIFDNLFLHGGLVPEGADCRVSIEFTALVRQ